MLHVTRILITAFVYCHDNKGMGKYEETVYLLVLVVFTTQAETTIYQTCVEITSQCNAPECGDEQSIQIHADNIFVSESPPWVMIGCQNPHHS